MKNRILVNCLRQFNPELLVSIKAQLVYGCEEKGYGGGEHDGFSFSQEYKISWNDGYLSAEPYDSYTVGKIIEVLLEKPLSKIGNEDFNLRPGELMNGNAEYETTWDDREPEDMPDDSELYMKMDIRDTDYIWENAGYIEFEVHWKNQEGENETILFVLNDDEVDRKTDEILESKKKTALKKKAVKKK